MPADINLGDSPCRAWSPDRCLRLPTWQEHCPTPSARSGSSPTPSPPAWQVHSTHPLMPSGTQPATRPAEVGLMTREVVSRPPLPTEMCSPPPDEVVRGSHPPGVAGGRPAPLERGTARGPRGAPWSAFSNLSTAGLRSFVLPGFQKSATVSPAVEQVLSLVHAQYSGAQDTAAPRPKRNGGGIVRLGEGQGHRGKLSLISIP